MAQKPLQAQQYNFKNYSVKEGVAQSQVYSLLQDARGYLWMGTRGGGISRFDGVNFKTYTIKDGLCNNYVYCIKQDAKKNLWIGTNNGISCFNGLQFKNYTIAEDSAQLSVLDMAFDANGSIWLATNYGVLLFENGQFKNITRLLKDRISLINCIYVDNKNTVWYGNAMGLAKITQNKQQYKQHRYYKNNLFVKNSVNAIEENNDGSLWIGTYNDGLYIFRNDSFFRLANIPELDKQSIFDICFDHNNIAYFATLSKGICIYNPLTQISTWLGENEGLSNNHVRSILQDKSGNYWFGTSGGGVCNYSGKQFTTYDKSAGLGGNFIYSIYRDSKQRLLIGTSDKGLTIMDSGRFKQYNAGNGFLDLKIKCILEDHAQNIYLGTEGNGLYLFKDSSFQPLPLFAKKYIRSMVKDQDGNIYVATAGTGIFKINKNIKDTSTIQFSMGNGLLSNRINCIYYDKKGQLWYGTENNGIGIIANNKVIPQSFNSRNGLPSNAVRCMTADQNGLLWIGTAGNGIASIALYQGDYKINAYDYNNGLTSSNIYLLTTDASNHLYAGSETGLDCITLNAMGEPENVKHYGKGEGFTGIETCQNAVFNDANGSIWFGTINGLTRYIAADNFKNKNEPITSITDIRLFYEPIAKTAYKKFAGNWNQIQSLVLPYYQNHLTFDFQSINFSNPEAVDFQWKLEGFDADWSPVSKQHTVTYSNLPYGDYKFLVKACNEDGVWNKTPQSFHFSITPPFWLRWWVIVLFIFSLGGIIYFSVRWRIKTIRKKAMEQQQKIQLEKEVLELEQKALRLQMNPHFIFNALNSIQSQIGTDNEQTARYYLAKFSRLMRQILDHSRNTTISLEEEISTLENYLLIEKFCNGERFDYAIEVDENIETDYIQTPPMLLQPFIENAIKHGLRHMEEKRGKITISIQEKAGVLECAVIDNGIGRVRSAELNKNSKETYHKSMALIVTQERLDLMKMNKQIIPLEIIDLYDEKGQASGTRVIIRIPL